MKFRFFRGFFSLAVLACLSSCSRTESTGQSVESLDTLVRETVATSGAVPNQGVGVLVVEKDAILLAKGYGLRDRESSLPFTADTVMPIGSSTKAFTAALLSRLEEEGLVQLGQTVKSRLPAFELADAVAMNQATPIDLLAHRTGMPPHDGMAALTSYSRAEIFARLKHLEPDTRPGRGFRTGIVYNNLMYMVAGHLAEQTAGDTWENLARDKLLLPLGMSSTTFGKSALLASSSPVAKPYAGSSELEMMELSPIGPAGSMNSNLTDLARWLRFHLSAGVSPSSGARLLSASSMSRLYQAHQAMTSSPALTYYGLGWNVIEHAGFRQVLHEGHLDGYSSLVSFIPERQIGVVVLVNQHRSVLTSKIEGAVYKFLGAPVAERAAQAGGALSRAPAFDPGAPGAIARFRHAAYGDIEVTQSVSGTPAARYFGKWYPLEAIDATTYWMRNLSAILTDGQPLSVQMKFLVDGGGNAYALTVPFADGVLPVQFNRVP